MTAKELRNDYRKTIVVKWVVNDELPPMATRPVLNNPPAVVSLFRPMFDGLTQEHFVTVWLNARNGVIGHKVNTIGTLNASLVHPREVFHGAILNLAAAVIVMHNHPSGDPTPSQHDHQITRQIVEAGKILEIPVQDHIIIGTAGFYSFAQEGTL